MFKLTTYAEAPDGALLVMFDPTDDTWALIRKISAGHDQFFVDWAGTYRPVVPVNTDKWEPAILNRMCVWECTNPDAAHMIGVTLGAAGVIAAVRRHADVPPSSFEDEET